MKNIAIVGATGRTGKMVAAELMELTQGKDVRLTLAGRYRTGLERLSGELGRRHRQPVEIKDIDLNERSGLRILCEASDVVVNCAGPYAVSGPPILATCVHGKAHYLDCCWEPGFFEQCQTRESSVREAGIAVVNGLGYSPGIADLAGDIAAAGWNPVNTVNVLYMVRDLAEGPGAKQSYLEVMKQPARSFVERHLEVRPLGSKSKTFAWPGGQQKGALATGGEIFLLPRHLNGIREIYVYHQVKGAVGMLAPLVGSLAPTITVLPMVTKWARTRPEDAGDASQFAVVVQLESSGQDRFAVVQGNGAYTATAKLLSHAALRCATDGPRGTGVLAPAQAFDARWLLQKAGLEVQIADVGAARS